MIEKIISIKNLGIFSEYKSDGSLPEFKEYNLIYGWNGSGKTTLSELFNLLEKDANEKFKKFKQLKYEIKVSDPGGDIKESDRYRKKIKVFNKRYISSNIHIEECKANSIAILGEENKDLFGQIRKDEKVLENLRVDRDKKEQDKKQKKKKRDDIFTEIAKDIGRDLGGHTQRKYRRPNAERDLQGLFSNNESVEYYILEENKRSEFLSIISQIKKEKIDEVLVPQFNTDEREDTQEGLYEHLSLCLQEGKKLCKEKTGSIEIPRLKKNLDISLWVEEGLRIHELHKSENCEFCQQKLLDNRMEELKSLFDEADKKLKKDIDSLVDKMRLIYKHIKKVQIREKANLYEDFQDPYGKAKQSFEREKRNLLKKIESFSKELNIKKEKPNDEFNLDVDLDSSHLDSKLKSVNDSIQKHNERTNNFRSEKELAEKKLKNHHLANVSKKVKTIDSTLKGIDGKINKIKDEITRLELQIKKGKAKISSSHKACEEINRNLEVFLGRKEIFFMVNEDGQGYLIKRGEEDAKDLSEGEKTAVALVYFLTSLKDIEINLSDTTLFFDDPVSSLDSNSMSQAFAFIKKETKNVKQIFISTHNHHFFKKIQSWFSGYNPKIHESQKKKKSEFYMVKNPLDENNKRRAEITIIDPLIMYHDSEYQYLFSVMKKYSDADKCGGIKEWYPLPNMARKFMESFLSFMVPSKKMFSDQLSKLFKRKNITATKRERLKNFLNAKSHAFPEGMAGFDVDTFCEIKEVLKDILSLVEESNKDHYDELVRSLKE